MNGFLRRLFFGPEGRSIVHPLFGKIILFKFKSGSYWEAEPILGGETIGVAIESANGEEPTAEQVRFYREATGDLEKTFAAAAPLLVPRFEEWTRQSFPSDWRAAFSFSHISIPIGGDPNSPWDVGFELTLADDGHLFTCYFENGEPVSVSVDG